MSKRIWVLLTAVFFLLACTCWAAQTTAPAKATGKTATPSTKATEKAKAHQATGKLVATSDTSLVIAKAVGKKKSEWTFARTAETKVQGNLAKDAKVIVYYDEENGKKIARRVKVLEPKSTGTGEAPGTAPEKSKATKPKT